MKVSYALIEKYSAIRFNLGMLSPEGKFHDLYPVSLHSQWAKDNRTRFGIPDPGIVNVNGQDFAKSSLNAFLAAGWVRVNEGGVQGNITSSNARYVKNILREKAKFFKGESLHYESVDSSVNIDIPVSFTGAVDFSEFDTRLGLSE